MISTRIAGRKDGKSSAGDSLRYGQGLKTDKETGEYVDKSHRTRFGNFGLIDDGVYINQDMNVMIGVIDLASIEMQSNCDLNTRVDDKSKIAHFLVSFDQYEPSEAVLRDTEDSMLFAMGLDNNHFSTFLHNDNGHWHLHIFASRIEKDTPYRVCTLWEDKTKRDKVCREIEIRHGLKRDNGMHQITDSGLIVEIPLTERRAAREAKRETDPSISDRAITTEIYSGEKTFQTWANEIRIGDRLKHAKSWHDLHTAAAVYNCEIKKKGNGLVICPIGEIGGIQLSRVGLKNLPAKFGAFQPAQAHSAKQAPEATYKAGPTLATGATHYEKWREAKGSFKHIQTEQINEQRKAHTLMRSNFEKQYKKKLEEIKKEPQGPNKNAATSLAKMEYVANRDELKKRLSDERQALRSELAGAGPGNNFRDYLVNEAVKGDDVALGLARRYGVDESTDVLRKREADQIQIVAVIGGQEYRPAPRMRFTHQIERNGTVVYDFGNGRKVTDSAISKQVQLNAAAAQSPDAIATALMFATTKFGNTLTLTGSSEFQRLAVETAVLNRLNINFKDPALQAYKQEFTASISHASRRPLTHKQIEKGAANVIARNRFGKPPAHILARTPSIGRPAEHVLGAEQHREGNATEGSRGLHELSNGGLDGERKIAGGVLQDALPGRVEDGQSGQDHNVRRAGASTTGSGGGANAANRVDQAAASTGTERVRGGIVRPAGSGQLADAISRDRVFVADDTHQVVPAPTQSAQSKKSAQRAVDVDVQSPTVTADLHQVESVAVPEPQPLSAHEWLAKWADEENKKIVTATPENADTAYSVVHVASDGIVLNKGRTGVVYPVPTDLVLHVGEKVAVDRNGELCLPRVLEKGGKNAPGGRG